MTHTAISQHIKELEHYVGRKLVDTSPIGSKLSDDGKLFHGKISEAFELLTKAVDELRPRTGGGVLRIWAAPGFAAQWLTPRFFDLQRQLSGTEILLRPSDVNADLARNEADIEIRYGECLDPELSSEIILRPQMIAVCSPAWLEANPEAIDPNVLARLPLMHSQHHQEWTRWLEAAGVKNIPPLQGPRFWNSGTFSAARLGMGPALANQQIIIDDIAAGRLVQITDVSITLDPYTLVYRRGRQREPEIAGFIRWIRATLAN